MINFIKNIFEKYFINSFFVMFPRVASIIVSLTVLPIILANLSINDYGKYQFVLVIQSWLILLSGQNITSGAKRGIAKGFNGTFLFAFFARLRFLVIIGLFGIAVSFFLYYICGLIIFSLLLLIIILFLIFGYPFYVSYPEFLVAQKRFKNLAFWETNTLTIPPLFSAIAAFFTHNILIFIIVYFTSISVISWIGWLYVVKKNHLVLAYRKGEIDKECLSFGKKLIPVEIISSSEAQISSFIIAFFFGVANLAVFSVADKLRAHLAGFIRRIRTLLYADFAKLEKSKLIGISTLGFKYRKAFLILILIFLIVCMSIGYLYIKIFLPQIYQMAIVYFLILSLELPAFILETLMGTALEANFRYKEITVLLILPKILEVILIIVSGFLFGIIGICFGIVLGAWIKAGFYCVLTLKKDLILKLINKSPLLKKLSNF